MKTKFRVLETPDYWLAVSEEEIKENDWFFNIAVENFGRVSNVWVKHIDKLNSNIEIFKIIAYKPKGDAPKLELPLLPEMVIEDDIENLANEAVKKQLVRILLGESKDEVLDDIQKRKHYFKEGYKAATKVYSEEDLIEFCMNMLSQYVQGNTNIYNRALLKESLNQPKTPMWFVTEMECGEIRQCMCNGNDDCLNPKLKNTTIDGEEVLVGTYLYE